MDSHEDQISPHAEPLVMVLVSPMPLGRRGNISHETKRYHDAHTERQLARKFGVIGGGNPPGEKPVLNCVAAQGVYDLVHPSTERLTSEAPFFNHPTHPANPVLA